MSGFNVHFTVNGTPQGRKALQILPSGANVHSIGNSKIQAGDVVVYEHPNERRLGHYNVSRGSLPSGTYPVALIRDSREIEGISPQFFTDIELWGYELSNGLVVQDEAS